jgi:hypothetical protein
MPETTISIAPDFWLVGDYANRAYQSAPFDDAMLASVERELGYRLPAAYVALMRTQNGGMPRYSLHPTTEPSSWAEDHISLSGMYGIGRDKDNSLCGEMDSTFWNKEWGYPAIGVYFADCPSAGHDMLCLDYSLCGPQGEPRVLHIDQEADYKKIVLAQNFAEFLAGLQRDPDYDDE